MGLFPQLLSFITGIFGGEWIKNNPFKALGIVVSLALTLIFSPIGFSGPAAEALGIEWTHSNQNDEAIDWIKEQAITESKYLLNRGVYEPERAQKLVKQLAIIRRDMGPEYNFSSYAHAEIMLLSKYKSTLKETL